MSDINTYLRLPFDKQFGELRSILSAGELDPSSAERAWSVMFAMASVDRARFLSKVLG